MITVVHSFIYSDLHFIFHFPFFSSQWDDETGKVMRFCLKVNPAIKIQILILILLSLCISYRSRGKKLVSLRNRTQERRGCKTLVSDKPDRPIIYVFCGSLKSKMFSGLVQKDLFKGG